MDQWNHCHDCDAEFEIISVDGNSDDVAFCPFCGSGAITVDGDDDEEE